MKQYILFTNEELDDMIHGCELSISYISRWSMFMKRCKKRIIIRGNL